MVTLLLLLMLLVCVTCTVKTIRTDRYDDTFNGHRELQQSGPTTNDRLQTTTSEFAGLGRIEIYGCMFEIHNYRDSLLKIFEYDIHTKSTDDSLLVKVYTSPGMLDYKRHPLAWQEYPDMYVNAKGADILSHIPRSQFPTIDITENSIMSFYITLTERMLISTKVNSDVDDPFGIASRNGDVGISYGVTKVWPFAEIQYATLFNGGFSYTENIVSLPPTNSPTKTPAPVIDDSSIAPSAFDLTVQTSLLNITSTFSGGMTNDGAMFEFRAKEGVILYTMDIITNYVGYVDIEIYFRRGSMKNVAFHPKAWTKISEFKLYGEGYSIPVRIPLDGGFEEITLVGGELCSFYITSITGPYIQMTEYKDELYELHEETPHVQMYVGYDKNYPFLHQNRAAAWNGRIYYNTVPSPAPTMVSLLYNRPDLFVCGTNKQDALICDQTCSSGLDSECPGDEVCYLNITPGQCKNLSYCGISLDDASQCNFPCPSGLDLDCPLGQSCFGYISAIECDTMNYCGISLDDAQYCGYPCPSGDSSECPSGTICWMDVSKSDCNNGNYCALSEGEATQCSRSCPSGLSTDCPGDKECFADVFVTDCDNNGYDDDYVYGISDPSNNFYCGESLEDALSCSQSCGITGLDSECPPGESCYSNIHPSQCKIMNYCGVDRASADTCSIACPGGIDNECPTGQFCFDNIAAVECENMHYCGISFIESFSCVYACPSGSSDECPSGMSCFWNISESECKIRNYCGVTESDVLECNNACPTGSDNDCPTGQTCFVDIAARECDSMNFCGTSLTDAQSCSLTCPSASNGECPLGETCYIDILPGDCTDLSFCGDSTESASQCNTACPSGLDNACPGNQQCFQNVLNTECIETNYCGTSLENARSCSLECPSGSSTECPNGEICFLNISIGDCKNMSYCGTSRGSATLCNLPCPSGSDTECPDDEFCFDDIAASDCETMHYCGSSIEDATSCSTPCPSGSGSECPIGQACFLDVSSAECKNRSYCGSDRISATSCSVSCASGLDSDCPNGQKCFDNVSAIECEVMHYCGSDFDDSRQCRLPCPSGSNLDCPLGEQCFLDVSPAQCKSLNFCGESRDGATQCNQACPSGSDIECPSNQKCFNNIAAHDCETMNYCEDSSVNASECRVPCPSGSSAECGEGRACIKNINNDECLSNLYQTDNSFICIKPFESEDQTIHSLSSAFDGTSATYGNMFDIFAFKSIIIMGVDLHISNVGDTEIELYITCCTLDSYDGVMRHPTAWTKFSSGAISSNGPGVATHIPSSAIDPTCISQGTSKGFYMTATEGRYFLQTKSSLFTGDVYTSNTDLVMYVGVGKTYWFRPNKENNVVWNGGLYYIILDDNKAQEIANQSSSFILNSKMKIQMLPLLSMLLFICF